MTYDWENSQSAIPIRVVDSKVTRIGSQLFSIGGGVHYWATSPDNGPKGWGGRLTMTFMFPR